MNDGGRYSIQSPFVSNLPPAWSTLPPPITRGFGSVFESAGLYTQDGYYLHYQLIRNVLAAYHLGSRFRLICDARRNDLIDAACNVLSAVRPPPDLLAKCGIVTWQEVARCAPEALQSFFLDKYGIAPSDSV